ncbi:unnamed protein product, partial [Phaedon cochleariae]
MVPRETSRELLNENNKQNPKMAMNYVSGLINKVKNLGMTESTEINVLLLGETGVGKSTFINSVANYLTYEDLEDAEKEKLLVLIPTAFTMLDIDGKSHTINTGDSDKNEFLSVGASATQDVKTYVFPIKDGKAKLRLIDTPGMGDTRGIEQDHENSENILTYIGQLRELHAICFLFKPNQSRNTVFFKYCMAQILSRLDKSASRNIIFVFTNTRGSDYGPGETISLLKKEIELIKKNPPHAEIPIERNIFCFDNEAFKYLAAVKHGLQFKTSIRERNLESWWNSVEQCYKIIDYIVGDANNPALEPHHVQSTNAINEARRMINQLAQPLAEISQNISQNMHELRKHEAILKMDHDSLDEFRNKLYIPTIALILVEMDKPATVCTDTKCAEVHQKNGRNIWHYKQRCHDPCYLSNVTRETIGAPELMNCAAMSGSNECKECGCDYRVHQHIYYTTEVKDIQEVDHNVEKNINDKTKMVEEAEKLIKSITTKKEELDTEHHIIVTTCARFAHFLQSNAITPFNDSYKEYIEYLINREQSMGKFCDTVTVENLRKLLREYLETKKAFDEALKLGPSGSAVTPREINASIQELFKLKHNGKNIKDLYECQKKSRAKEFSNTEYFHDIVLRKWKEKMEKNNDKKGQDKKAAKKNNKRRNAKQQFDKNTRQGVGLKKSDQITGPGIFEGAKQGSVLLMDGPPPYQRYQYAESQGHYASYGRRSPRVQIVPLDPYVPEHRKHNEPEEDEDDNDEDEDEIEDEESSDDTNKTIDEPIKSHPSRSPYFSQPGNPYYPPYYPHRSEAYGEPPSTNAHMNVNKADESVKPPPSRDPYYLPHANPYYPPHANPYYPPYFPPRPEIYDEPPSANGNINVNKPDGSAKPHPPRDPYYYPPHANPYYSPYANPYYPPYYPPRLGMNGEHYPPHAEPIYAAVYPPYHPLGNERYREVSVNGNKEHVKTVNKPDESIKPGDFLRDPYYPSNANPYYPPHYSYYPLGPERYGEVPVNRNNELVNKPDDLDELVKVLNTPYKLAKSVSEPDQLVKSISEPNELVKSVNNVDELNKTDERVKTVKKPDELVKTVSEPDELVKTVSEPDELVKTVNKPDELVKTVSEPGEPVETVNTPDDLVKAVNKPDELVNTVSEPDE